MSVPAKTRRAGGESPAKARKIVSRSFPGWPTPKCSAIAPCSGSPTRRRASDRGAASVSLQVAAGASAHRVHGSSDRQSPAVDSLLVAIRTKPPARPRRRSRAAARRGETRPCTRRSAGLGPWCL